MKRGLSIVIFYLFLLLQGLATAGGFDLHTFFPNLIMGTDPNGPDSVYVACGSQSPTQSIMQVRIGTDNLNPDDYIQGVSLELLASADEPGVCLDTSLAAVFGGGAVSGWGLKTIYLPGGDPCAFPLQIKLGAVELDTADVGVPLGPGGYLFADLRFGVSAPTNITVTGTNISNGPAIFVTTSADGYSPKVKANTCGPIVPTLSEWGLIFFSALLLSGIIWYVRRHRTVPLI